MGRECEECSMECGMWSVEFRVWSIWSLESGEWSMECGVWSMGQLAGRITKDLQDMATGGKNPCIQD